MWIEVTVSSLTAPVRIPCKLFINKCIYLRPWYWLFNTWELTTMNDFQLKRVQGVIEESFNTRNSDTLLVKILGTSNFYTDFNGSHHFLFLSQLPTHVFIIITNMCSAHSPGRWPIKKIKYKNCTHIYIHLLCRYIHVNCTRSVFQQIFLILWTVINKLLRMFTILLNI